MATLGTRPRLDLCAALRVAGVGIGLGLWVLACSWSEQRPTTGPSALGTGDSHAAPSAPTGGLATAPLASSAAAIDAGAPVEVSDTVLMQIQDVEGTSASRAGAILGSMTEPVGRCTPPEPGVLNVRLRSEGRHTAVEIAPGSTVSSETRRCVVDALGSLDLTEAMPEDSTPSVALHRFASTVSISW